MKKMFHPAFFYGGASMLPRTQYLNELIDLRNNGRVKIITGLRRSGKSVLLFDLYRNYLIGEGIKPEQIIGIAILGSASH